MATYYVRSGGTAANKAAATSDSAASTSMSISTCNSQTWESGDVVVISDAGGLFRGETLYLSGVASGTVTYQKNTGGTPKISGFDLVTGWEDQGSNVWRAALAGTTYVVLMDGVKGQGNNTGTGDLVAEGDWWHSGGYLYIYSTSDPDTAYTDPGVEAGVRFAVSFNSEASNIILDGIFASGGAYSAIRALEPGNNCVIRNCIVEFATDHGIGMGNTTVEATGWVIEDNECRYCGYSGITVLYDCNDFDIRRNYCHHNGSEEWAPSAVDFTGGIKVFDNTDSMYDIRIYENECAYNGHQYQGYKGRGVGIWADATEPPTGTIDIYRNYVHDNWGNGIFVEIADDTRVWGNLCVDNGTVIDPGWGPIHLPAGIDVDIRGEFSSEQNLIYNNTVIGGQVGLSCAGYDLAAGRMNNNIWRNNIAVGQTEYNMVIGQDGANDTYGSGNVYNANCFGAEPISVLWNGTTYTTYDTWLAASSQTDNNVESDPSFTDADNGDYSLASDDAGIGAGVNLGPPFDECLLPGSVWPSAVLSGSQDDY